MHAELFVAIGIIVRDELTCDRLRALMYELARIGLFEVSQPVPVSGIGSRLRFSSDLEDLMHFTRAKPS